ncbi:MAG: hypothetical protein PUE91_10335 [Clostridiales bacterium]|nr:hypothetical protein [Clostridiales bacterium]
MAGNVIAGKDSVFCNDAVFIANVASLQSGDTVACLVPVDTGTAIIQGWNKISIERMSVDKPVVMRYNQYQRSDYFRTRILLRVRVFFFYIRIWDTGYVVHTVASVPKAKETALTLTEKAESLIAAGTMAAEHRTK